MSRVKHLFTLITKLAFLVLVCAATMVMGAMQTATADEIPLARDFNEKNIEVMTNNGATLRWEVTDGELVFEINQSGDTYDDIAVFLTFNNVAYDSSFMRSMLGEDAGEYEQFISEMENGPWLAHCNFSLKGESLFTTGSGRSYTFSDAAMTDYVKTVVSSAANETEQTESFNVSKDEGSVMVMLTFGAEDMGAMKNGKYTLKADLKLLHPEGKQLDISILEQAGIVLKFAARAVAEAGLGVFNVTNWLTFYGVLAILGWFIYMWRDIRTMIKIFFALLDSAEEGTAVIIRTYINGVYAGERTEYTGDGKILVAFIMTMLCYVLFIVTTPIRIIIHIIRDIIYLFKEDYDIEAFSFLGNFIGSMGIYAFLVGIVGLVSANYVLGGIAGGVGLVLCIAAHFICKRREEDYG